VIEPGDFGPFDGRTWLNCAHQGPLPRVAVEAAERALALKVAPSRLSEEEFARVPRDLRGVLGRLLGVPAHEVVLGNSTTHGLHLLARGLPLRAGDEVLLVDGDFPATVVPWLPLRDRGVRVRLLRPGARPLSAHELAAAITPATRVFCASWVFSFFGDAVDVDALGAVCRERGVLFVVNGAQAVGVRPLDVSTAPIDAVVGCGFKWLCGPYGTGFAWVRPDVLETLEYEQAYWLAQLPDDDLSRRLDYSLRDDLGAAAFDVFGTANFNNFLPWTASVEYLLGHGIEAIAAHVDALVERLLAALDGSDVEVLSPREGSARSSLVVLSHRDASRNAGLHERLAIEGIDVALREGNLRLSPHLYNGEDDIDAALAVLAA
jgi:selenocysteine lyase/cysteine desulfurase